MAARDREPEHEHELARDEVGNEAEGKCLSRNQIAKEHVQRRDRSAEGNIVAGSRRLSPLSTYSRSALTLTRT